RKIAETVQRNALFLLFGTNAMQVGIAQNAEKPGLHPIVIAQLIEMRLRLAISFLRQILGIRRVTAKAKGVAVQSEIMLVHQPLHQLRRAGSSHGARSSN